MKLLHNMKEVLSRRRRIKELERQLGMTVRCTRELDCTLAALGLDFSRLELCPLPEGLEDEDGS